MEELERDRLIQERWFTALRWLLLEAWAFYVIPEVGLSELTSTPLGLFFAIFGGYTLLLSVVVFIRRAWPESWAHATSLFDTILCVVVVLHWSDDSLNLALIGLGACAVAVGLRRFPIFETFAYSFIIVAGMVFGALPLTRRLPVDEVDILVIGGVALVPLIVRAGSMAPSAGAGEGPIKRLADAGTAAIAGIQAADPADSYAFYAAGAVALGSYSGSQLAGVLVEHDDGHIDLITAVGDKTITERLGPQTDENLSVRLLALTGTSVLARKDNLHTRGLPDQYPPRLDNVLATPLMNITESRATIFAASRHRGPFRDEDRLMAEQLAREIARSKLARDLQFGKSEARLAAADALLTAAESKRPGSRVQADECARFAVAIARELSWDQASVDDIWLAALLHDIGELAVPDSLLDNPGELTPEQFQIVDQHPRVAARIIDSFNRSELVLTAVYSHHERWDGRGYPSATSGEDIPVAGRIICLADAMEAMLSDQVYRPALSTADALQEIILGSGTQFDPTIVQAFLAVLEREGQDFLQRRDPDVAAPAAPPTRYRG